MKKLLGHFIKHIPLISCRVVAQAQKNNVHLILCEINNCILFLNISIYIYMCFEQKSIFWAGMISSTNNKLWRPKDKVSNPVWYPFSKLDDAHRNVSEKISSQSLSHLKMLTMPHDMVLETAHQFCLRAENSNRIFLLSLSEHLLEI